MSEPTQKTLRVPVVVLSDANREKIAQLVRRTTIKKPLKMTVGKRRP